jgi:hypothetical protein
VLEAEGAKRTLELKSEGRKIQLANESEGYLIQVKNEALATKEKLILEVRRGERPEYITYRQCLMQRMDELSVTFIS